MTSKSQVNTQVLGCRVLDCRFLDYRNTSDSNNPKVVYYSDWAFLNKKMTHLIEHSQFNFSTFKLFNL
jgi:hypothetical protein